MWLVCCKRPLRLDELVEAIAIDPGDLEFDIGKKVRSNKRLLDLCGPLLHLNPHTKAVELGHFSVTEFLLSKTLPNGSTNPYFINKLEANGELMKVCLTYIQFHRFETSCLDTQRQVDSILQENVFLEYATIQWPFHAKGKQISQGVGELIFKLLRMPSSKAYLAWSRIWQYKQQATWTPQVDDPKGHYFAALFELDDVIHGLVRNSGLDDTESSAVHGQALIAAAHNGNAEMAKLLLEAGADVNYTGQDRWTALNWASWKGFRDVVITLLKFKAGIKLQDRNGWTALHCATFAGHGEIVVALIGANAQINVYDTDRWTPLHRATEKC